MIPLIGRVKELENQKAIVVRIANEVLKAAGMKKLRYMVGTMIEIPRAALTADLVAKEAEFFSFGTNDSARIHSLIVRVACPPCLMSVFGIS